MKGRMILLLTGLALAAMVLSACPGTTTTVAPTQPPPPTAPPATQPPSPTEAPTEGIGAVEAPRGVLIHHYKSDERGVLTFANLIVATQHNSARIAMSVDKAARSVIHKGIVDDGILNQVEMAFRAYDPCHACATHSLPGHMPLWVRIYDDRDDLVREFRRDE